MRYDITYRNCLTKEEYTLGVDADNHNEAVKIAKKYRGDGEEIAGIVWRAASVFDDIINAFFSGEGVR